MQKQPEYSITEKSDGTGYEYRIGDFLYQPFHPGKEGFVPMSLDEAEACVQSVLLRLDTVEQST